MVIKNKNCIFTNITNNINKSEDRDVIALLQLNDKTCRIFRAQYKNVKTWMSINKDIFIDESEKNILFIE